MIFIGKLVQLYCRAGAVPVVNGSIHVRFFPSSQFVDADIEDVCNLDKSAGLRRRVALSQRE
ncbi:MAG: hypothetical protein EBY17_13465 [Acidobacteriia bacterium]|nr:hypothetical protein [Terriglobia bacterium]